VLPEMWPQCGITIARLTPIPPGGRQANVKSNALLKPYISERSFDPNTRTRARPEGDANVGNGPLGGRFMLQVRGVRFLTITC
jgi:hypothetical protein